MRRLASHVPRVRVSARALRIGGLVALASLVLGGGWLWARDSSLVAVERVEVIGLSSTEGDAVRRALETAARGMTTLHVREDELMEAVAHYPSVAALRAQADFPHGLSIEVTEREPIAEVDLAGDVVAVGAGGRLMRGVEPERKLPVLHATRLAPGDRLTDPEALEAVSVLAAAPEVLRERVKRIWSGPKGLSLDLRSGPQLFFGSAHRPVAKWMAIARVLAEPSSEGAVYLDVRVPERVAAGGLGTPPTAESLEPQVPLETAPTLEP
jgi:cell division protein FtsQ